MLRPIFEHLLSQLNWSSYETEKRKQAIGGLLKAPGLLLLPLLHEPLITYLLEER